MLVLIAARSAVDNPGDAPAWMVIQVEPSGPSDAGPDAHSPLGPIGPTPAGARGTVRQTREYRGWRRGRYGHDGRL
jgi:hypothetical protein